MRKLAMVLGIVLIGLLGSEQRAHSGVMPAAVLWLTNDMSGSIFQTDTAGNPLIELPDLGETGVAFDGVNLYLSDHLGNITKRTADGATVLDSFSVPLHGVPSEDLAWDSTRQRLWRIDHAPATLVKINPATGMEEAFFPIVSLDPTIAPIQGYGVAYDPGRDLLYLSFCQLGCPTIGRGVVLSVAPDTGAIVGELFRTSGFDTGGLAYDPVTDTLFVGDYTMVRHMTLAGAVLSSFTRPSPGSFVDGLEIVRTEGCTLNQTANSAEGNLSLGYLMHTTVPVTWNLYIVLGDQVVTLVSTPLGVIDPALTVGPFSFPFPPSGGVGFLTTMTTPTGGILCADFDVVDTGNAPGARKPAAVPKLPIPIPSAGNGATR